MPRTVLLHPLYDIQIISVIEPCLLINLNVTSILLGISNPSTYHFKYNWLSFLYIYEIRSGFILSLNFANAFYCPRIMCIKVHCFYS